MKKPCKYLRFYSLFLLLLLASHVSAQIQVKYDSETKTLTFSGSGVLTKNIVDGTGIKGEATTIVIKTGVTEIGEQAFYELGNIKNLDLENAASLRTIGKSAFESTGLASLTVPYTLETIEKQAFFCCPLKTIVFETSSKFGSETLNIGANAFTDGNGTGVIEEFRCFRNFTYEGMYNSNGEVSNFLGIFTGEQHLTTVTFGGSASEVPKGSFWGCRNLTNLTFSSDVYTIGEDAFLLTGLTSIWIPSSVQNIGNNAFYQAPLKTIAFGPTSKTIKLGASVFSQNMKDDHGVVETVVLQRPFTYAGRYDDGEVRSGYGLFQFEDKLTDVTLYNMSSIPDNTFNCCDNITNLSIEGDLLAATYTVSNNLATIFPKLQNLTIENTSSSIGAYAFFGSSCLKSITIPFNVTSIGEQAFGRCPNVTSLNFDARSYDYDTWWNLVQPFANSITDLLIPNNEVSDHEWTQTDNLNNKFPNLINVTFGPAATKLHNFIFRVGDGVTSNKLKTVTFKEEVTVGTSAFRNNAELESVTSSKIKLCDVTCFMNCKKLTDVNLRVCEEVKINAFIGCTGLTSVSLASPTIIASGAFAGCTNLTSLTIDTNGLLNQAFTSSAPFLSEFPNVKKLTLGSNVYQVGEYAFYGSPLQEVTFSGKNTAVGKEAFSNSLSLTTINGSVKSVDEGSFQNTPISSIKITDDDVINDNAFNGCGRLTSVELPNNLSIIGASAFENCTSLSSVTVPSTVNYFMDYAFKNCTSLTSITLPTVLRNGVFSGCTSLSEITIPQSVNILRSDVFADCTNLKIINIESPLVATNTTTTPGTIFPYATTVNFGENVKSLGYKAFASHQNLEEVSFASPCNISGSSFNNCSKLRTVNGTVIPIGSECFANCSQLASIEIDGSTSAIGTYAFSGCRGLTKVVCYNRAPVDLTNNLNVFANVPVANVELDVPYYSRSLYAEAVVWKDFGDLFAIGGVKLQDGVAYTNTEDQYVPMIRYTRTFPEVIINKWQCLYVPFDITVTDELLADFDFAKLYMVSYKDANENGEIEDDEPLVMLLMKQSEGKVLHANTPYFIKAKTAGAQSIEVESATLKPAENGTVYCCTTEHEYTLTGVYDKFNLNGYYTLGGSGNFSYYSKDSNLNANRWYMSVNSLNDEENETVAEARQILIMVDGEDDTTGIMDITNGSKVSSVEGIFTLDGRKINETDNLPRGIYIKNGKKILVK